MGFFDRFQDKSPDKDKGERGRERERDVPVEGYVLPESATECVSATVCNGNVYPYPSQDQPILPDGVFTPMSVADNQALLKAVTMASTLQEQNKALQETVAAMQATIHDLERERNQAEDKMVAATSGMRHQIAEMQAFISTNDSTTRDLRSEMATLKASLRERVVERDRVRQQLVDCKAQLATHTKRAVATLNESQSREQEVFTALQEARQRATAVQGRYDAVMQTHSHEVARLKNSLAKCERERVQAVTTTQILREGMRRGKRETAKVEAERDSTMSATIQVLAKQLAETETSLQRCRAELTTSQQREQKTARELAKYTTWERMRPSGTKAGESTRRAPRAFGAAAPALVPTTTPAAARLPKTYRITHPAPTVPLIVLPGTSATPSVATLPLPTPAPTSVSHEVRERRLRPEPTT
ncbi:hypothetical protein KIPB_005805 [Kipferlia bialata]|uniref:Uncharacterized protein n=1 Tax=Kipferlia bialata TaxID=797122 RepID=A0A9K3CWK6_9EUKA|nr:hypothetical protein KIPB_005805 [Kipferlia bialata]|eukprot:g5805.t1